MNALKPLQPESRTMSEPPMVRGLDQILSLADNGQYLPDLLTRNEKLIEEIVNFSQAFGTKAGGKLQITISYTTDRFGQIELSIEDKITEPKPPKAKAVAWTTPDGGLTTANPNQTRMEIRDVGGRRELRSPGDGV